MVFMIARWFAKRFLHPDIVAEYSYIFLWDEDLGVEDFHPEQYVGFNLLLIEKMVCVKSCKIASVTSFHIIILYKILLIH
jgi:hypothetical protein